jgi:hypothetical protein
MTNALCDERTTNLFDSALIAQSGSIYHARVLTVIGSAGWKPVISESLASIDQMKGVMNMAGRFIGALIVLVTLVACGPKVIVDYDKTTDFTAYRTYAWGQGTPAKNPLMDRRIVSILEEQLAAKGYQKVERDPDMFVSCHAALTQDIEYNTTSMGYDKPMIWRGSGSDTLLPDPEETEAQIREGAEKMFKKFPPPTK